MAWQSTQRRATDLPSVGTGVPVVLGDTALWLVHHDGSWFGVEDRCSHAGCAFSEDGEVIGADIICACHGSEFDVRSGDVRRGPAHLPIRTIPVRAADGWLEVDL